MSCIPPCVEGEGAIPLEELDRWTDSINHVLENKDARRYFREYLSKRELEEALNTLEFWELCEKLAHTHPRRHPHSSHHKSSHIGSMRFLKDARDLVSFAEDKVNLDLAALQAMTSAVETGREDRIRQMLREAMQSAVELLQDDYQLFRTHLLKQRGLGKTKN